MWEVLATRPLGRLSMRNFLLFATTIFVALLANLTIISQHSSAASDATWSGDQISYNSATFTQESNNDGQTHATHAPSDAAAVYVYANPQASQVQVIFFPKGSDPASSKTAQYYIEPDVKNAKSISIEPKADPPSSSDTSGKSSCSITGIGWIVCPVTEKLASGMDYLFKVLTSFLTVAPLSSDQNAVIYKGWSYMRNFANIAFVIAFLIIIYSQITNIGISSYGIKKLLPRLVFAAILVNVSYWICAVAVDLSNIFGSNLNDMFESLRKGMMSSSQAVSVNPDWSSITNAALAGTGIAAVGIVAATGGGVLAFLVPILMIVVVSALTAIIVLAARQAIIVVLIMIAPIAFVAFLLPNTEKYFHKWRETFMTLLLLFPIFSFLFGGAQLAGTAIILTSRGNIVTMIFGMAVQVIPLAITPLMLKFSGSILGKIGGYVNNPQKGIIDRSKNWASGVNGRQTTRSAEAGNMLSRAYLNRKMDTENRDARYKKRRENLYGKSKVGTRNAEQMHSLEREAKRIEAEHDMHINAKIQVDKREFEREMRALNAQDKASVAKTHVEKMRDEYKSGYQDPNLYPAGSPRDPESQLLQSQAVDTTRELALLGMSKNMAQRNLDQIRAQELKDNTLEINGETLQQFAGGILGEQGELSVLASAKKTASKYMLDDIDNIKSTMDYDIAKDNSALHEKFETATTMAQRVAYAQAMSKNGAPGIGELKKVISEYESKPENKADLDDFKELLGTESSILSAGKDLEFWITKSKPNKPNGETDTKAPDRTFNDLTNDLKTWTNLSASAFAAQNASTHHHALELLHSQPDRAAYQRVVNMIRNNPAALSQVKQGVRERFSIYSDAEIANNPDLPAAGTMQP